MITGAVLSLTLMVCAHDAELPLASVALYVLVKVYLLTQVWLVITSLTQVTVGGPQLSAAVTEAILTGSTNDAHWTDTLAGHVMVGGCKSRTVTVNEQVEELPAPSVTLYATV